MAETLHLLEEALRSHCEVKAVLAAECKRATVEAYGRRLAGAKVVVLPDALFAGIAATETSQGVIALVQPPEWKLEQLLHGKALVVVLDGLQDPGNAGAIVRAAEAFGATGVAVPERHGEPVQSQNAARLGRFAVPRALSARHGPPRLSPRCGRTASNCTPPCRRTPPPPAKAAHGHGPHAAGAR